MPFPEGTKLAVTNQNSLEEFLESHYSDPTYNYDPEIQKEGWIDGKTPTALYIVEYNESRVGYPYYTVIEEFSGNVKFVENGWNEKLLSGLLEAGILRNTETQHIEVIEQH